MFFVTSKILSFLIDPHNLFLILLVWGWILLWKKPKIGRRLIGIGILIVFIFGLLKPLSDFLIYKIENRIPAGTIPEHIDGVIVLTGIVNMKSSRDGLTNLNSSGDRIIEAIVLLNKHPEAKLIISGGSGSLIQDDALKEPDFLKRLAEGLGISSHRIIIEKKSRNTHESAVETAKIIKSRDNGKWVLVTSAFHMPRSMGVFRKADINPIPYPVDFKTSLTVSTNYLQFPRISNLGIFNLALHEGIGLLSYWLMDYTDTLFPKAS